MTVNDALLEPAAIVTAAGTATALLVLASIIARAFGAFALKDAVHVVFSAPVKDVFAQESDFSAGVPATLVAGVRDMEYDFVTLP